MAADYLIFRVISMEKVHSLFQEQRACHLIGSWDTKDSRAMNQPIIWQKELENIKTQQLHLFRYHSPVQRRKSTQYFRVAGMPSGKHLRLDYGLKHLFPSVYSFNLNTQYYQVIQVGMANLIVIYSKLSKQNPQYVQYPPEKLYTLTQSHKRPTKTEARRIVITLEGIFVSKKKNPSKAHTSTYNM